MSKWVILFHPCMDAQEIFSLDTCCAFIPLTRDVQDDIVFSDSVFVFDRRVTERWCSIWDILARVVIELFFCMLFAESYGRKYFLSVLGLVDSLARDASTEYCFVLFVEWFSQLGLTYR